MSITWADSHGLAADLIDRYSESLSWRDAFSMRVTAEVRGIGDAVYANGNIQFSETKLWLLDGRFHYESRREIKDHNRNTYPNTVATTRKLFDNDYAWEDLTPEGYPNKLIYRDSKMKDQWAALWFTDATGGMLDGYVPGSQEQSVLDLLRSSLKLTLISDIEDVNGVSCYVVEGTSDYGVVRVWIDPERDSAAVKFLIRKEAGHLFEDTPLSKVPTRPGLAPTVLWEAELVDAVLARIANAHVIVSGELRLTLTTADGQVSIIRYLLRRSDIDLSPDGAGLADFDNLIVDGVEIVDADLPALRFEWRDGTLEPKSNPLVENHVRSTIARYLGEQDRDSPLEPVACSALENAYCGLYCLYAAGQLTKREFAFPSLLRREYIGAAEGSSIAELERAAQDHGLYTAAFDHASVSDLESNSNPIVLFVKSNPSDPNPNHFVLFLAAKPNGAMIFEPPSENSLPVVREVPYYELASIWNGKGLSLATESIAEPGLLVSAKRRVLFAVLGILLVMSAIKFIAVRWQAGARLRSTRQLMILSVGQTGAMIAIAASLSFVFHVNARGGFFSAPDSASFISGMISRPSIQKLSIEELPEALAGGSAVLIDARSPEDFESKHIPGAINLSLGLSKAHRDAKLREFPRDTLLVTYCDPKGCPLSARLAIVLLRDGFSNIRVLEGDWTVEAPSQ